MIKGTVAIVGRPNVGKSTLYNRLTKSKSAIVDDRPGVTRDRLYGIVERVEPDEHWDSYIVIDTGGFEKDDFNFQPFADNIVWQQTEQAIRDADLIVLVFDGKEGPTPHDKELLNFLRTLAKPVIYAVNKIDGIEKSYQMAEFYQIGAPDLLQVSAAHNRYVWELSEAIEQKLATCPRLTRSEHTSENTRIAIIGRPNVGKSSLLNRLVGEERAIVSPIAGTTRDAIDSSIVFNKKSYTIVDTAGIRRKTKISDRIESLSVMQSLRGIENADIVLLIIGPDGVSDQDAKLAQLTVSKYKPLLIIVNKWDLVTEKDSHTANEFLKDLYEKLGDLQYVPVVFVSCLHNQRVHSIMSRVESMMEDYNKRVPTAVLNECLQSTINQHTPALMRTTNKRVKFYYATQVRVAPPTIVIKCNVSEEIHESYKRYLSNQFRKRLDYGSAPLRLLYREKAKKEEVL